MEKENNHMHHEENHRTKSMIRVTMACNERCPFCNVPMEDYNSSTITPSERENQKEIDRAVAQGEKTLVFSGGEPTILKKRLLSLLYYAKEKGIEFIELQSNAVKIDAEYAQELRDAGVTSAFVSFLSHISEKHDILTGLPGSFDPCVRGIDHLLQAGIPVTLNPVLTSLTQDDLIGYIEYVAKNFPKIQYISLSAMQPHGRGKQLQNIHFLPDYHRLKGMVQQAQIVAKDKGIELLNPYCGLPVCIGWENNIDRCVESEEAKEGGWKERIGINNQQDKIQQQPCQMCLYRNRCGGAWIEYWRYRGGEGIVAPKTIKMPWENTREKGDLVFDVDNYSCLQKCLEDMSDEQGLVRWLYIKTMEATDIQKIVSSSCTDIGWVFSVRGLATHDSNILQNIRVMKKIVALQRFLGKQRTHICIPKTDPIEDKNLFFDLVQKLDIDVHLHLYDGME